LIRWSRCATNNLLAKGELMMDFKVFIRRVLNLSKEPRATSEVAPGVFEERRYFLWASAGMMMPRWRQSAPTPTAELAELDFKSFAQQCATLAKQAAEDATLNQDAHIFRISSLASRLKRQDVPKGKLAPYGKWDPPVELGPIHRALPLSIGQWRLAPYAVFPPHNHSPANVVSLCLEGECRVRHFDIIGEAPAYSSPKTFLIRETQHDLLTPGRMSSLTMLRDNIHQFKAGKEGALGIDINTILPGDKPFSFLRYEEKPKDVEQHIYEAVWTAVG
jgi:hypothetical protein